MPPTQVPPLKKCDFLTMQNLGGFCCYDQLAIDSISESLLYARVDLVRWDDAPALIELELIEPSLYFSDDAQSATRFAQTLDRMVLEPC
jgi:hypothetical protein